MTRFQNRSRIRSSEVSVVSNSTEDFISAIRLNVANSMKRSIKGIAEERRFRILARIEDITSIQRDKSTFRDQDASAEWRFLAGCVDEMQGAMLRSRWLK